MHLWEKWFMGMGHFDFLQIQVSIIHLSFRWWAGVMQGIEILQRAEFLNLKDPMTGQGWWTDDDGWKRSAVCMLSFLNKKK